MMRPILKAILAIYCTFAVVTAIIVTSVFEETDGYREPTAIRAAFNVSAFWPLFYYAAWEDIRDMGKAE